MLCLMSYFAPHIGRDSGGGKWVELRKIRERNAFRRMQKADFTPKSSNCREKQANCRLQVGDSGRLSGARVEESGMRQYQGRQTPLAEQRNKAPIGSQPIPGSSQRPKGDLGRKRTVSSAGGLPDIPRGAGLPARECRSAWWIYRNAPASPGWHEGLPRPPADA